MTDNGKKPDVLGFEIWFGFHRAEKFQQGYILICEFGPVQAFWESHYKT